jgi:putative transposase
MWLLADGREAEFRNRYRLTYPIAHDPERIVWQIDHKAPLHVLVRDLRAPSHRSLAGEVRPFLTLVVDSASRLIMAGLFSYDRPDRFMVAAAIRAGMLTGEHKPYGGVPDEIWVDNGKELIAQHVHQLALGLGITLVPGPPHEPQVRGIVERLHETLDTRLWATLPGYVGANVIERNPQAKAELTPAELDQRFRVFVDRYHQEVHSATGQTPLSFWQEHAPPLPVDERLLDVLLKEPAQRRVLKEGIKYAGQVYWHTELAILVGEDVLGFEHGRNRELEKECSRKGLEAAQKRVSSEKPSSKYRTSRRRFSASLAEKTSAERLPARTGKLMSAHRYQKLKIAACEPVFGLR